ncbi:hypothetical protein D3C75_731210 [compost metagenome]
MNAFDHISPQVPGANPTLRKLISKRTHLQSYLLSKEIGIAKFFFYASLLGFPVADELIASCDF